MLASDYGHKYSVDSDGDLEIDIGVVSYVYLTEKDLLDMLSAVRSRYNDKFKGE